MGVSVCAGGKEALKDTLFINKTVKYHNNIIGMINDNTLTISLERFFRNALICSSLVMIESTGRRTDLAASQSMQNQLTNLLFPGGEGGCICATCSYVLYN